MFFRTYAILFLLCLNIDFSRQFYMKYKIRSINLQRKLEKSGVPDLSFLSIGEKIRIYLSLGIAFGPKDKSI